MERVMENLLEEKSVSKCLGAQKSDCQLLSMSVFLVSSLVVQKPHVAGIHLLPESYSS